MAAADELRSLQKHFVCQFEERWNQTDREIHHNVAGQRPKTTKEFIGRKKLKVLDRPSQSPDFNPTEHAFYLLKRRLKGEPPLNNHQLKEAAVKAWKSVIKEECKGLGMSVGRRLDAVIARKGFATK